MDKRMKLQSFSIPSSKQVRPSTHRVTAAGFRSNDEEGDSTTAPLFITVFEPSQTLTPDVKPAVHRPLPNSGRLINQRSGEPADASTVSGNTNPAADTSKAPNKPSSPTHTSYGLIVRNNTPVVKPAVISPLPNSARLLDHHRSREPIDASSTGAGTTNTSHGVSVHNKSVTDSADAAATEPAVTSSQDGPSGDLILQRYKEDMALLPDQPGEDEYDEVPVEGFGAALLAGYGWKEGDAIGRTSTKKQEEAKVVHYDRPAGPQGLGFDPSRALHKKRDRETRDQIQEEVPNAARSAITAANYKVPCLHSHIRVRVVSKDLSKRLYMMKGRVVDVTGPTTCDVAMDDGTEVVQGVEQDMLETVLPPVNGHVLVLCGRHKGVYGRLVEKNPEERTGVLEDADSRDMIRVELDKIAEYVGDPELIGY
uniref:Uncharacterized protein n=1 Tax=Avena sativa TaxID=4498 RepID=A0ACD5ZP97_AVESA